MVISFYGEGCFKISASGGQGSETTILTDPPISSSGLTLPRFKFDILLKTLTAFPTTNYGPQTTDFQQIIGPGEYNIQDIDIAGLSLTNESTDKFLKTIYLVEAENIRLCFLGHLSQTPEPEIAKNLEEIDVLFIPAGGKPFLEQKSAGKLIKQIRPKIAIPSFYKVAGLKRPAGDLKIFLGEINHQKADSQEKLTIKKKNLEAIKKTEIVILTP